MKVIGITGGIGSGKSEVLSYMEKKEGVIGCQADVIAAQLQKLGGAGYNSMLSFFGQDILEDTGEQIDRKKLSNIVFNDEEKLNQLNKMIHPLVKKEIRKLIDEAKIKGIQVFVIEAALLMEDYYETICDELWYIYAREEIRIARLKKSRPEYSNNKIMSIMNKQATEEAFRNYCDKVIDNSGDKIETYRQVDIAFSQLENK